MVEMPTQLRGGVKGGSPLQGQGAAPLVGFGATPQPFHGRPIQREKLTKVQAATRPCQELCASADAPPKLLYPPLAHCRAKWARPHSMTSDHSWSFPQARISPLRRRPEGFAVALWTASQHTPMLLDFYCCRGIRACGRDKGQRRRYPFLKYSPLCCTIPSAFCTIAGRRCWVMSASITS